MKLKCIFYKDYIDTKAIYTEIRRYTESITPKQLIAGAAGRLTEESFEHMKPYNSANGDTYYSLVVKARLLRELLRVQDWHTLSYFIENKSEERTGINFCVNKNFQDAELSEVEEFLTDRHDKLLTWVRADGIIPCYRSLHI